MRKLGARALAWIRKYLDEVRPQLSLAADEGVLFLAVTGDSIGTRSLGLMVSDYIKRSGVNKSGSCHLFRHTMATLMLENEADVRFVQVMLGHAQLTSTQIYTQVARLARMWRGSARWSCSAGFAVGLRPPSNPAGRGESR
ncbi:tyrosine-type recombinase/integrase [Burkholderia multivorans]|uniref:tyrosine-type recombinase/integrase n=1 Tax=Burkholderia multivorans TaxID=87883 RepID=UPI001C2452D8|nr:tyrosine-type recombinase/integrase [Burkholderia multivorans]MBU9163596.1 tyrosine-type recombinase/integrase [Burkholderia multivorans]MBU9263793.1 tyrosine-type recombinase/integrase [Burkholderia multivorans]